MSFQTATAAALLSFIWGALPVTAVSTAELLPSATAWAICKHAAGTWIGVGRIYTIMHSPVDVLAGALLAALTVAVFLILASEVLDWMTGASWLSSVVLAVGSMLVYPKPQRRTPSFLDAVAFNGAALGVALGAQYGMRAQPILDTNNAQHVRATLAQVITGLLLCGLAKEAVARVAQNALGALCGTAPQPLRSLWQLPVHDEKSMTAITGSGVQSPRHLSSVRSKTYECIVHVRARGCVCACATRNPKRVRV